MAKQRDKAFTRMLTAPYTREPSRMAYHKAMVCSNVRLTALDTKEIGKMANRQAKASSHKPTATSTREALRMANQRVRGEKRSLMVTHTRANTLTISLRAKVCSRMLTTTGTKAHSRTVKRRAKEPRLKSAVKDMREDM